VRSSREFPYAGTRLSRYPAGVAVAATFTLESDSTRSRTVQRFVRKLSESTRSEFGVGSLE